MPWSFDRDDVRLRASVPVTLGYREIVPLVIGC